MFAKVLPFTRVNFVTLYQSTLSIFVITIFVHLVILLNGTLFSIFTRLYPRVKGLKTIHFPVVHTCIANIWEYPPPLPFLGMCYHDDMAIGLVWSGKGNYFNCSRSLENLKKMWF